MSSVHTDGHHGLTDGMLRIKKKKGGSLTWRSLRVFFTDGITEGFKTSAPYGEETGSPMKMPMKSPRDSKWQLRTVTCPIYRQNSRRNHGRNSPSVNPSVKVNISPLTRPYPPLFFLLLPHLNSPQLQTTSPPPKKNLPLLSTTSHISWSILVTASVFWFTYGFLSVFISNSIF